MRTTLIVVGGLFVLMGAVWVGQGLGYVKGSFMTGEMLWTWIGLGLALVGVMLIVAASRGRRGSAS